MKADFHLHSAFSGDSNAAPEDIITAALRQNLEILCFTDHLDQDYPYRDISFDLDTKACFSSLQRVREKYADQIQIRIGVELGLQPHLSSFCHSYVKQHPFDFVIGSTHLIDGLDPYYPDFWEIHSAKSALRRWYEVTLENIRAFRDFDVCGHLDYIFRYTRPEKQTDFSNDCTDLIDEILKTLIENGKGIEVNTGGFKAGLGAPNPCPQILRRYRKLGGEIITTGSDAHSPEYVGYCFDRVYEILRACGFRYFTIFKERKAEFIKL